MQKPDHRNVRNDDPAAAEVAVHGHLPELDRYARIFRKFVAELRLQDTGAEMARTLSQRGAMRRPLLRIAKTVVEEPLRAARGDDDLMSQGSKPS